MTVTIPRMSWKAFGVIFTSVIAPLGLRMLDAGTPEAPPAEPVPFTAPLDAGPQQLTPDTTRVVAQGTGSTPEAAFQNAMDSALQQSIASEMTAAEWTRYGQSHLASLRRNGNGVLRGWRELSSTAERHLTGRTYRSEVAVEVDGAALRERLRPAHH